MKNLLKSLTKLRLKPKLWKTLPEGAGVYIFLRNGTPIYIGKAINLKRRVASYFDLKLIGKTERMMEEATHFSYIKVDSELEALLLEAKLIRFFMPHYNSAAKDDKHPLYIVITKEEFPRVLPVRKLLANGYSLLASFGPFPSSANVRSVLRMLRRVFPFSDHKIGKRACLYAHIGLCNPCPNEIVQSTEYIVLRKKYLKNIKNINSILNGNITKVKKGLEKEMTKASKDQDFEAAVLARDRIQKLEYITRPQIPTEYYVENPNLYEDQRKLEIRELEKLIGKRNTKIDNLTRIECYDIAHLSGVSATASMVTFVNGAPEKEFYRHFKIRQKKGNSDIDSLKEVISRRIKHLAGWGRPDLIVVDGGVAQVNAFTSILYSNEVVIPVIGIAKNPDRLIMENEKIKLKGPALNLVSRIRDEAHRFARRYHHELISISLIQ